MISILLGPKEVNFDFLIKLIWAQGEHVQLETIPTLSTWFGADYFTFVNWLVFTRGQEFPNNEKDTAAITKLAFKLQLN